MPLILILHILYKSVLYIKRSNDLVVFMPEFCVYGANKMIKHYAQNNKISFVSSSCEDHPSQELAASHTVYHLSVKCQCQCFVVESVLSTDGQLLTANQMTVTPLLSCDIQSETS